MPKDMSIATVLWAGLLGFAFGCSGSEGAAGRDNSEGRDGGLAGDRGGGAGGGDGGGSISPCPDGDPLKDCLVDVLCVDDSDCPTGHRCNESVEPPECVKLYCGRRCAPCSMDEMCAGGLSCSQYYGPPGQCRGVAGDWCRDDSECAEGLVCKLSATPIRCEEPGSEGDECWGSFNCVDGSCWALSDCVEGLVCRSSNKCAAPGTDGDTCLENRDCKDEAHCVKTPPEDSVVPWEEIPGRCRIDKSADDGGECNDDWTCVSGLDCSWPEYKCYRPGSREDGDSCYENNHCMEGLLCNRSLIVPKCIQPASVSENGACDSSDDCADPLICNEGFTPPKCVEQYSSGTNEPCENDYHCKSGLVCNPAYDPPKCVPEHGGSADSICGRFDAITNDSCDNCCEDTLACSLVGEKYLCKPVPTREGDDCFDWCPWDQEDLSCNGGLDTPKCVLDQSMNDGEPCSGDDQCRESSFCHFGYEPARCASHDTGSNGDPCWPSDAYCKNGLRCNSGFEKPICRPENSSARGEPCGDDDDCSEGLVCFKERLICF